MEDKDLNKKFDEMIARLKDKLPKMKEGVNCAELTFTSVLKVLGIDNGIFHNLIIPLAGGLGGYKSKEGWQGACGAVCGGCAALGVIMGGKERMHNDLIPMAYLKASKFATDFENQFGSVVCSQLCGFDFSKPDGYIEYRNSNAWETKCCNFVIWAVNHVRRMSKRELKKKWK
ncbi:MAG: C-GCAxxG-C-C family protein [Promethearchaeota archaeon]